MLEMCNTAIVNQEEHVDSFPTPSYLAYRVGPVILDMCFLVFILVA
jgi:hypothetical protein